MPVRQSVLVRFATELGFDPHEVESIVVQPKSVSVTLRARQTDAGDFRTVVHQLEVQADGR